MCKRKTIIFGLLVLISLLTSLPAYAQLTIQQITRTGGAGEPACAPETADVRNNFFVETPTTVSADGTIITFLSNCDLTPG